MSRSVFYGFGAFVGSLTGSAACGWWSDDPAKLAWDHAKLVPVDLGKNPEAHRRGLIKVSEIECDDFAGYAHGGLTKIGPMWPGGTMTGACYLESDYWSTLPKTIQPTRIPHGFQGHAYELTTVLYWDGPLKGRRFHGFHVEIKSVQGASALVALWNQGTSRIAGQPPHGSFWIDLAAHAHPIEKDFTEVGVGAGDPKTGALFLDANVSGAIRPFGPKVPPFLGHAFLVARSR
jgi:hypothetical protein